MHRALRFLGLVAVLAFAGQGQGRRESTASSGDTHGIVFFGPDKWLAYVRVNGDHESVVTRFPDGKVEESEAWDSVTDLSTSADGRTLTYVATRDEHSKRIVNGESSPADKGKPRKAYGQIVGPIQVKPDTSEPIFIASSGPQQMRFVVIGERESKAYDNVYAPRISADGKTIGYVAELNRKSFVVINDRVFGPYSCCIDASDFVMDADGSRFAYPAGEPSRLVVNGVPSSSTYDHIENVVLSPPGSARSRIAFTAVRGAGGDSRSAVVVNGVMGAEYETTRDLDFSGNGDLFYVAEERNQAFPVHEGEPGPRFDAINDFTVSDNGKGIAFNGITNGKARLVYWTGVAWKEGVPYENIDRRIFFDATDNAVYRATRKGRQFVVIGDREQTPYDAIHDVRVGADGRGVLAVASLGKKMMLVLDGREIAVEEGIGDFGTPEKHRKTESRWEAQVRAGRVQAFTLEDGTYHLQLNDKTIYTFDNPTGGGPAVFFRGKVKDEDAFLLIEYHGDGWPEMHRLIAIDSAGEPFVSESFGVCHGDPDVRSFEDRIEITYRQKSRRRSSERWVYRPGGKMEH